MWIAHPVGGIWCNTAAWFTWSFRGRNQTFTWTLAYRWKRECGTEFEIVAATVGIGKSLGRHWNAIVWCIISIKYWPRGSRCRRCWTKSRKYYLTKATPFQTSEQNIGSSFKPWWSWWRVPIHFDLWLPTELLRTDFHTLLLFYLLTTSIRDVYHIPYIAHMYTLHHMK